MGMLGVLLSTGSRIKQRKVTHGGGANSAPPPTLVPVPIRTVERNKADSISVI